MTFVQLIDFKKIIESLYCYQHGLKIAIIYTYCDKYQCCVVLCCFAWCCVVFGCVGLCWAILGYAGLCCAMLRYVVLCCVMLRYVMSCHVIHMSCHTHVMLCHVMLCTTFMYVYIDKINLFFVTGRLNAWYIIRWQPYTLEHGGTQVFIKRTSLSG